MVIRSIMLFVSIALAYWVYIDAGKRGMSQITAMLWGAFTFLVPYIAIPTYLLFRFIQPADRLPRNHHGNTVKTLCSKCGHENPSDATSCSACKNSLKV